MQRIVKNILLLGILLLVVWGCDENSSLSTEVSPVESLYEPQDEYSVTLETDGTETFEWAPAKAADGGVVMYEVVFDSVGADFSDPLYRVPSNNNGIATSATISHETLNKAAAQAGLESEETGQLSWSVASSKGINEKVAAEQRTIQITRLPGFANPPNSLYITGEGSEAGGNLEDAMPLKSIADGEFLMFTRLGDGSFKFVNNKTGSPREFTVSEGSIVEDGSGSTVDQTGVYRIHLNFTTGAASLARVQALEFYSSPHDEYMFELPYRENGVFRAEEQPYSFYEWDWGRDSRYKFRLTLVEDGTQRTEWLGNDQADVDRPDDSSPPSYWYLYSVPEGAGQYEYIYKLPIEYDDSFITVSVFLQADREEYTHEVEKVGNQE